MGTSEAKNSGTGSRQRVSKVVNTALVRKKKGQYEVVDPNQHPIFQSIVDKYEDRYCDDRRRGRP